VYYIVYQTTNIKNGKIYIGKHQTDFLDDGYIGSGHFLNRAIKRYGLQNFKREILFVLKTEQEMNAKEAELVSEEFCDRRDTYNICPGGQGGWGYVNREHPNNKKNHRKTGNYGFKLVKPKLADPLKISHSIKKYYEENGSHWLGRNHSDLTKNKISEANKVSQLGERNSQFGSIWITNGTENRKIKRVDIIPNGWYTGRTILK